MNTEEYFETIHNNFDLNGKKRVRAPLSDACRICLGEDDEHLNPLISPCMCSGTMKNIHVDCLK